MNTNDIEKIRKVMLEENNPLLASAIEEVIEVLDEIQESLTDETPITTDEPVDMIRKTLMKNLENYLESMSMATNTTNAGVTTEAIKVIASQTIDNLPVKHFVGIQPMTAPVGLVYSLEYEDADDGIGCLSIISHTVEARSRKFTHTLPLEPQMDISAAANAEGGVAAELSKEIYEEIRNDISNTAYSVTTHLENIMDGLEYITQHEIDALEMSILKCANDIARNTRRGAGNFAIVSETVAEILKNSTNFITCSTNDDDYGYVKYLGTLHGTIKVYCDFNLEQDKTIIGYKGGCGETDVGYIYAPYIQLMSTGIVVDPFTFQPLLTFMTRYGKVINQTKKEDVTEDGLTSTITREPCKYYIDITFNGLPNLDTLGFKKEETSVAEDSLELVVDAFDVAMKAVD